MKVVIIDSGANEAHKAFKSGLNIISAVHIYKDSTGRYAIDQKIEDRLGTGQRMLDYKQIYLQCRIYYYKII